MKQFHSSARPYWVNADLMVSERCPIDFGNPSGHAFHSMFQLFYFWMNFFKNKKIIFVLMAVLVLLTGYSRMLLGVHSLN
jgi:membrane-associated phospholipid phosphatase